MAESSNQRPPVLVIQPSVQMTTHVETRTTTTTYITLPPLPTPSSPKDPKLYPLINTAVPRHLRQFPLVLPGGGRATFRDADAADNPDVLTHDGDEDIGGQGWRMLRRNEHQDDGQSLDLQEALERYGRKRTYGSDVIMEGIESSSTTPPPRKKARAAGVAQSTMNAAAPPSPLPSPHGSPLPQSNVWPTDTHSGTSSPQNQLAVQPDLGLTTLLTLPSLLNHFCTLPPQLQSHFLLTLLRHSPLQVLRTLHSVLTSTLARDFLTLLPPELVSHILSFLPYSALARASRVSKAWRAIIDSDAILWCDLLISTRIWFGGESERAFAAHVFNKRHRQNIPTPLPLPHPYKMLFKSRHLTHTRWVQNDEPRHLSFPAHGSSVVTCLIFSNGRIISASDDHRINVFSPYTGELLRELKGHEGGVWALAANKDTLVSGSTDRNVRIWDLNTGKCTHVFGGHTSTVRCLAIVKPEWLEQADENGVVRRERWPKRPLIVTGSRDNSLRVWALPKAEDPEYKSAAVDDTEADPSEEDLDENPYHLLHLEGHDHAVRALAVRGRTLVSGSYDCTVRVWDIVTGKQRWKLTGHAQKVYSVVLDISRNQACSGSMDGTVRVWNLKTGECAHTLSGHTSLVGLLGLSPSYLVSAAADSTLRIWDPDSGEIRHTLAAHTGAITCFQHDEFKVLSGSDTTLKMWNIRDGTVVRDLLTGITGVWQVIFEGRWCVAASSRNDATVLDVWDFGKDGDDEWVSEVPGGMYDDDDDSDDEDDQNEGGGFDDDFEHSAMDQDSTAQRSPDGDDGMESTDEGEVEMLFANDRSQNHSSWNSGPSTRQTRPSKRPANLSSGPNVHKTLPLMNLDTPSRRSKTVRMK